MKKSIDKIFNHAVFDKLIILLILLNVTVVILESIDSVYTQNAEQFILFRSLSYVLFSFEYFVRISRQIFNNTKHINKPYSALTSICSPIMLVDALVILLFYLKMSIGIDPRLFRMFRVLNILQVIQNSRSLHILQAILVREKRTLLSTLFIMFVLVILEAAIIYALEHKAQPEVFSNIPEAIWWTMTTLTTVGYGDAVPITPWGKFFGTIVMFIGISMFAIPTGILVSAFYQEIKRKDFIATWDLVAKVPFFAKLTATDIALITDLLTLHIVRKDEVIFHQGDTADCMYFIVDGEVEIKKPGKTVRIKGGNFFGEIGILYDVPRIADVTAKTYTELLMLNSRDIELFMEYHPQMRETILKASERRQQ